MVTRWSEHRYCVRVEWICIDFKRQQFSRRRWKETVFRNVASELLIVSRFLAINASKCRYLRRDCGKTVRFFSIFPFPGSIVPLTLLFAFRYLISVQRVQGGGTLGERILDQTIPIRASLFEIFAQDYATNWLNRKENFTSFFFFCRSSEKSTKGIVQQCTDL